MYFVLPSKITQRWQADLIQNITLVIELYFAFLDMCKGRQVEESQWRNGLDLRIDHIVTVI